MDSPVLFQSLVGALLTYLLTLVIYRLYLHPLSRFPGSKLTASTLRYEFYHDCIQSGYGGQLIWRIESWHRQYGPIVRINPHELHIMDPDFYQELYGDRKMDKYQWWCNLAGAPGSMFATADAELHRKRRVVLNNFFSKKAVAELEPLIREKIRILVGRFEDAAKSGEVVRLDCAFMALTMDVICSYCFGKDRGYLSSPDFGKWWKELINGAWQKWALMRQFPWMPFLLRRFP